MPVLHKWKIHTGLAAIMQQVRKLSKRAKIVIIVDGRYRKFDGPKLVQDVLVNYPGYAISVSDNRSTPLKGTMPLQPGKTYVLSRAVYKRQSSGKRLRRSCGSRSDLNAVEKRANGGSRHVSFASTPSYIEPLESSAAGEDSSSEGELKTQSTKVPMEMLPWPEEKAICRLKVVMSRREYEQLLQGDGEAIVKKLLNQLSISGSTSPTSTH